MLKRTFLVFTLSLLGSLVQAQGVGSAFPKTSLADFAQTEAKSLDDYFGRAILIEFFAHW